MPPKRPLGNRCRIDVLDRRAQAVQFNVLENARTEIFFVWFVWFVVLSSNCCAVELAEKTVKSTWFRPQAALGNPSFPGPLSLCLCGFSLVEREKKLKHRGHRAWCCSQRWKSHSAFQ